MWFGRRKQHDHLDTKFVVDRTNAERSLELAQALRERSERVLGEALGDPVGESLTEAMQRKDS